MKAIQLTEIGSPLVERMIDRPALEHGDVVVRVTAAGICHSDAHYRAGRSPVARLPITPGHEVAGIVEQVGSKVDAALVGRRVCIHYLVTCGACPLCRAGHEQFCPDGQMIGKHRDGGFAEYIVIPERNAVPIPDNVPDRHAAIMMCSTATSYHALRQARMAAGEKVAVIGCGGLGMSAIQLAQIMGAREVFAVDIDSNKLQLAHDLGAQPVDGRDDPALAIKDATSGRGVDVALELIGTKQTCELAVALLAPKGRAAIAGLLSESMAVRPYPDIINREVEIVGVSDHLLAELEVILDWASTGELDLNPLVSATVPLAASPINRVLDELEAGTSTIRTVIEPAT